MTRCNDRSIRGTSEGCQSAAASLTRNSPARPRSPAPPFPATTTPPWRIADGEKLTPLEVKSGQSVPSDFFAGLRFWRELAGDAAAPAALVYGGDRSFRREDVTVYRLPLVGPLAPRCSRHKCNDLPWYHCLTD